MVRISEHFTLEEMIRSTTADKNGINNNIPNSLIMANVVALIDDVLEPVRMEWGKPLRINSGYRCAALNKVVGGSPRSYHLRGQAADIRVTTKTEARALAALFLHNKYVDLAALERKTKTGAMWLHVQMSDTPRHKYTEITS